WAGRVNAGAVVSRTVTSNELRPRFPRVSVEEHCTVVVPSANVEPEACVQVTVRVPSTTSVAVAVKVTAAPLALVASATMSSGTVTAGPNVSTTVTLKPPLVVSLSVLVAEQLTRVVPNANRAPDPGEQTIVPLVAEAT